MAPRRLGKWELNGSGLLKIQTGLRYPFGLVWRVWGFEPLEGKGETTLTSKTAIVRPPIRGKLRVPLQFGLSSVSTIVVSKKSHIKIPPARLSIFLPRREAQVHARLFTTDLPVQPFFEGSL